MTGDVTVTDSQWDAAYIAVLELNLGLGGAKAEQITNAIVTAIESH